MSPANTPPAQTPAAGAADPSMEDILASIRRILSEDESEPAQAPAQNDEHTATSDVLALDPSMLVDDTARHAAPPPPLAMPSYRPEPPLVQSQAHAQPASDHPPTLAHAAGAAPEGDDWPAEQAPLPPARQGEALLAPESSAAAVASMGSLLRTLISEHKQVAVHANGPTIEDVVREEVRPILKKWLDTNLPPLVERLVRTEIERVVGRALS